MEAEPTAPAPAHLAAVRARVERALNGGMNERKAVVQALVDRITVDSRASVRPTFRFPNTLGSDDGKVCALARSAPSAVQSALGSERQPYAPCQGRSRTLATEWVFEIPLPKRPANL